MKSIKLTLIILLMAVTALGYSVRGTVLNAEQKTPLEGANIQLSEEGKYTFTDAGGHFSIRNISLQNTSIKVSFIGYKSQRIPLDFSKEKNLEITVMLEPSLIQFEAVRVTITKSEKKLSNSPLPITTYNDYQIEQQQPLTTAEAIANTPGITMSSDGIWSKSIAIRGLSRNNIVTLVDGNRISTATNLAASLSLININDVDRIETIKSGASMLYGTGATGGVINVITKKAPFESGFYLRPSVKLGYNSVNTMHYENLNLFTGAQQWNMKIALQNRSAGNTETPDGKLENSQFDDQNLALNFNYKPFKNHKLSLNVQKFQAQNVGIPGGKPLFPPQAEVSYKEAYRELYSLGYEIKNLLPAMPKLSFKVYRQNIFREVENKPHIINSIPASESQPAKEIHVQSVVPEALHETTGFLLQSNWLVNENNWLIVGIDGWQKKLDSNRKKFLEIQIKNDNDETIKTIDQVVGELPLPNSLYSTTGLFINNDHYFWNKKLIMNLGGRYDLIRIDSEKMINPDFQIIDSVRNDTPPNQTVFWNAEEDLDHSWSANIGLLYKPRKNLNLSLNFGKSFRSPTLEERFDYIDLGNLIKLGDPRLNAEQSLSKDIGMNYSNDTYTLGANLFHNSLTDLVIEKSGTYDGRPALIKQNAGEALLYGYEIYGEYNTPFRLSLSANLAYVHGEDRKDGVPLASIPPLNGQLFITYPVPNLFNLTVAVNAFADQERVADWETETAGYTYYNLYLQTKKYQFMDSYLQLLLRADNITDKKYQNHLSTNRGLMQWEPGRNISLNLSIDF